MRGGGRISSLGGVPGLVFVRADKDSDGRFNPLTSASWYGDSFSTSTGPINWNTLFGVPSAAKAVVLRVQFRDSGAAGNFIDFMAKSTGSDSSTRCYDLDGGNALANIMGTVPIAADGTSWYTIVASGVNTMDVWILVVGWYV